MSNLKTRIAAGVTIIGLGGLAGLALGSGQQQSTGTPVAERPVVRTKVIRRTIHVTKHAKPKHPVATGSGGGALAAGSTSGSQGSESATTGSSSSGSYGSSYSSESTPVTTSTSGASSPTSYESGSPESGPVTTSTSGGGSASAGGSYGGESEHESEGGGDD